MSVLSDYKPREDGQADFISGPKLVHFDRVEWHINPDAASVTGAVQVWRARLDGIHV